MPYWSNLTAFLQRRHYCPNPRNGKAKAQKLSHFFMNAGLQVTSNPVLSHSKAPNYIPVSYFFSTYIYPISFTTERQKADD